MCNLKRDKGMTLCRYFGGRQMCARSACPGIETGFRPASLGQADGVVVEQDDPEGHVRGAANVGR
jgi:hypothetical protein